MNFRLHPAFLIACSMALVAPLPARAYDDLLPACRLLSAADLKQVGFEMAGRPRGNTFDVTTEQSGAPSELHADVCFFYSGVEGSRVSANVTVETFVEINGVAEWIATKNSKLSSEDAELVPLGDTTCEKGRYVFSNANNEDRGAKQEQRYVSCDRLHANKHVIIGFETPVDSGAIPDPKTVSRLLDEVVKRL